jgi:hypothetical protein
MPALFEDDGRSSKKWESLSLCRLGLRRGDFQRIHRRVDASSVSRAEKVCDDRFALITFIGVAGAPLTVRVGSG